MKLILDQEEKDAILIHFIFAITCVPVLLIPFAIGIKLLILVIFYNFLIPLFGYWRNYEDWIKIWLFSLTLSIFQIWPDWFLASQLGTIVFPPDDGIFHIGGAVSAYMAGLWTIPFFNIIFIGQRIKERKSLNSAYLIVALTSFLIFTMSEGTLWILGSWYAQNVHLLFDHIAIYILVPEIILGLSTFYCYEMIREKTHWMKVPVAFIVMMLYVGTAASSYFLIERLLFPI